MRFSIYSEIQYWGGKTPKRAYEEVIEQVVHADRLGYDAYAIIEHFFFPKFSISANPFALCRAVRRRAREHPFRTLRHVLPFHNPTVLASQIAAAAILIDGPLRVRRRPRPRLDPAEGRRAASARRATVYEESLEILFQALRERALLATTARFYKIDDAQIWPPPRAQAPRSSSAARATRTYELAGRERLGRRRAAAPSLRGAQGPARHLPRQVRRARQRARHRLDPRLLHRRGPRHRAARGRARHAPASSRATRRR